MYCKQIVLNSMNEVVDFINTTERVSFPVTLKRQGDVSAYDGKSLLSVVILAGWNIEVYYSEKNELLEDMLMKYRVTELNMGWYDYVFTQHMDEAFMSGESTFDSQHIKLVRLFNYLADACERDKHIQARRILFRLEDHTALHFEMEEKMAARYDYPDLANYKLQHEKLSKAISHVEQQLSDENVELPDLAKYVYKEFFPMFFDHIKNHDLAVCRYVLEKRSRQETE